MALKVLDGNLRVAATVGLHALARVGALPLAEMNAVIPDLDLTIYGGGRPVGTVLSTIPMA